MTGSRSLPISGTNGSRVNFQQKSCAPCSRFCNDWKHWRNRCRRSYPAMTDKNMATVLSRYHLSDLGCRIATSLHNSGQLRVTNGPRCHVCRSSVHPPTPDEIAAARKSAARCQEQTWTLARANRLLRIENLFGVSRCWIAPRHCAVPNNQLIGRIVRSAFWLSRKFVIPNLAQLQLAGSRSSLHRVSANPERFQVLTPSCRPT
jgi:hypothetical protein